MITKTMAYKVGNETFPTFEEAQIAAITDLFKDAYVKLPGTENGQSTAVPARCVHEAISGMILDHADELIEILMAQPEEEKPSRKPRKDKGTKRAVKVENATVPVTNTTTADAAITQIVES